MMAQKWPYSFKLGGKLPWHVVFSRFAEAVIDLDQSVLEICELYTHRGSD
jgi:hypothetical protein